MLPFLRSYWTPAGKRALFNLAGLVGCQVVSQGCVFGLLLAFTHGLGPVKYAAVATSQVMLLVLIVAGTAGVPAVLVRELAARPGDRDEIASGFFAATGVCSLTLAAVVAAAAAVLPLEPDERWLWWLTAASGAFACLAPTAVYDADHRQAEAAARQLPGDIAAAAAAGVLWATDAITLPAVGLVLLGRVALQFAVLLSGLRFRWQPSSRAALELARGGWPLVVGGLLYLVPSAGSVVVLRMRAGDEPAALFGLANQLASALPLVFGLFVRVVQPHANGPHGLEPTFLWKLTVVATGVLFGLAAAGTAAGWAVFAFVIGPAYAAAFPVYLVMLAANVVYCSAVVVSVYLIRFSAISVVNVATAMAVGGYLLIAATDSGSTSIGAAWAMVFAWVVLTAGCAAGVVRRWPGRVPVRTADDR